MSRFGERARTGIGCSTKHRNLPSTRMFAALLASYVVVSRFHLYSFIRSLGLLRSCSFDSPFFCSFSFHLPSFSRSRYRFLIILIFFRGFHSHGVFVPSRFCSIGPSVHCLFPPLPINTVLQLTASLLILFWKSVGGFKNQAVISL